MANSCAQCSQEALLCRAFSIADEHEAGTLTTGRELRYLLRYPLPRPAGGPGAACGDWTVENLAASQACHVCRYLLPLLDRVEAAFDAGQQVLG